MARIPLEDDFTDVLRKAQRGRKIADRELAAHAGVTPENLTAVFQGRPLDAVLRRIARHLHLSPDALEELAHKRWYPVQPDFPRGFLMFNTPYKEMSVNSYLVWDPRTRQAAAFDTGSDCSGMLTEIETAGLKLQHIFLTHTHRDHVADLDKLAAATGADVWASELEPCDRAGAKTFKENAHFHVGSLAIKTLATTGHSPGQTTYYVTGLSWPLAIVGDSLFSCSMGSSPGGFLEQFENNRTKIFTLQKDTVLACGHGPLTTLAQEKRHNPFFAR
jgi:glyoxylase-like metal-dependent hydrolase (beta-lactamase superfamily II)